MRPIASCLWIAVSLLVCGVGCAQRAAEQVAAEVQQISIHVDGADSYRIGEGQPVPIKAIQTVMQERMWQIEQSAAAPVQSTIRISVDDSAPYSNFAQAVEACRESGFFKFELAVAEFMFPFDLTPLDPNAEVDDLQIPPLRLRLQASEDGELDVLTMNDRRVADITQLQLEIIGLIGDDRGPGSIQEMVEVEFDCDDNLWFRHLAAAYLAVSGYQATDGSRVTLVAKIWPMTKSQPQVVQEMEEFEVLEELTPLSEMIEAVTEPK